MRDPLIHEAGIRVATDDGVAARSGGKGPLFGIEA
jgi:hypothetical protein